MSTQVKPREWDYAPAPEGEPFQDADGNLIVGYHDRSEGADEVELCAAFEAFAGRPLQLRPILARWATEVECKINGWEEGTFTRCTTRAKNPMPMWQIEELDVGEEQR